MESHQSNGLHSGVGNTESLDAYLPSLGAINVEKVNDLPDIPADDLAQGRPATKSPASVEDVRDYVTDADKALLFVPADSSQELAMSAPARAFLDFFPASQTKQTMQYLCFHTADKFFPEDSPAYQPREEFMTQQAMLRKISLLRGGGVFRLPDLTLRLAHQNNNKTSHFELHLYSKHLLSDEGFLGTLFTLYYQPLAPTTYAKYQENQQLISPKPNELTDLLRRFVEMYYQKKTLASAQKTVSDVDITEARSQERALSFDHLWLDLLDDSLKNTSRLSVEEFRQKVEQLNELTDISRLREADRKAAELREAVQSQIRKVLGIKGHGTVSFHNITSSYKTKDGNVRKYSRLKASWRDGKKMRGMDVPEDIPSPSTLTSTATTT
jgi:hypothetical protein